MLSIFITNLGRYNEGELLGEWLVLPCSRDKLSNTLKNIGINKCYEEWFITDYSCELSCVCNVISEYSSVDSLNRLAERLQELEIWELEKLEAIAEYMGANEVNELLNLTYNLDCFSVYNAVTTKEELGEYYFYELSAIEIPESLIFYFDFESYGRDIELGGIGMFTQYGFVDAIDEVVDRLK